MNLPSVNYNCPDNDFPIAHLSSFGMKLEDSESPLEINEDQEMDNNALDSTQDNQNNWNNQDDQESSAMQGSNSNLNSVEHQLEQIKPSTIPSNSMINAKIMENLHNLSLSSPQKYQIMHTLMDGQPHSEQDLIRPIKKTRFIGSVAFGMMLYSLIELFGKERIFMIKEKGMRYYQLCPEMVSMCQTTFQDETQN
jgi:hypothetical protein